MKIASFILALILIVSCAPSTQVPVVINTVAPLLTSTHTPLPTSTKSPTLTPSIPTSTITPMAVAPISIGPFTLDEFNVGTGMKRLNVIGTGTPQAAKFSPDGKRLAVATGRGIYLYDGVTFEPSGFVDVNDSVSTVAFSPDGNVLAVAVDGKVSLWNILSGQNLLSFDGGLTSIYKLVYGRGGYVAAIGSACRGCGSPVLGMILWNAKTGKQIFSQHDIWYSTTALTFTSDGKKLIFGGVGGINIIESESGKQVAVYGGSPFDFVLNHDDTQLFITSMEFDSEVFNITTQTRRPFTLCGIYLTSSDTNGVCPNDKQILLFDLTSGEEIKSVDVNVDLGEWNSILTLSPDNHFLVYFDNSVMNIYDLMSEQVVKTFDFTDFENVLSGIVELGGVERYVVATVSSTGDVVLYDLQTGLVLREFKGDEITGFAFAPNGKTVATINAKTMQLRDLQSQQVIYEAKLRQDSRGPIAFLPNGSGILLTNPEVGVLEFNLQTKETKKLGMNAFAYTYADLFASDNYHFNQFGNLVMLGYEKNNEESRPSFMDINTQEKIVLPYNAVADPDFLEAFALDANGKYLAFGNASGIFTWDIAVGKQISYLDKHERRGGDGWMGAIRSLIFNPKSDLLVSVGWDGTTRLWNIVTGTELRRLNVCCSASFTPDGRFLVTAGDGVIRVWGIP